MYTAEHYYDVIDQLRTNYSEKFVYDQPNTPIELIREVSDQIPFTQMSSVLVMFTVEWAVYLRMEKNIADVTVVADNDAQIEKICKAVGVKYINIKDLNKNMKFDVVVGNPPFQSDGNNGSHGLWQQFSALALEKSNICAAIITPHWHNWAAPTSNALGINKKGQVYSRKNGRDYDVFRSGQVKQLVLLPPKKYFDVGSTFCWTLFVKEPVSYTNVICEDRTTLQIDFRTSSGVPSVLTPLTYSIYSKLLSKGSLQPLMDHQTINISSANYRTVPDHEFKYKWIYSAGKEGVRYRWIKTQSNNFYQWKVLIPISAAGNAYKYASVETECNQSQDVIMFVFDAKHNADLFLETIQLPFFVNLLKMNTGSSKHAKLIIPAIDFTRSWSDAELYSYFNFTQAEIEFIKSAVK